MDFFGVISYSDETDPRELRDKFTAFLRKSSLEPSEKEITDSIPGGLFYLPENINRLRTGQEKGILALVNGPINKGNICEVNWRSEESILENIIGGFFIAESFGKNEISLLVDPNGIQQAFYWFNGEYLVLSDDLRAVAAWPEYKKELNLNAVDAFFSSETNSFTETFFKGIFRIEAGQRVTVSKRGVERDLYWFLKFIKDRDLDLISSVNKLNTSLENVMKRYLENGSPDFALLLSGGLDSSFILGVLARIYDGPISTFTVGYEEKEGIQYDEIPKARVTAEYFKTSHHEILFTRDEFRDLLFGEYTRTMDEPNGNIANLTLINVVKEMSGRFSNVLNGLGPDSFFYSNANDFRYGSIYTILKFLEITGMGKSLEFMRGALMRMEIFDHRLNRIFFTPKAYIRGVKTMPPLNHYRKYQIYNPLMLKVKRQTELFYDDLLRSHLSLLGNNHELSDAMAFMDLKLVVHRNFIPSSCQIFPRAGIGVYSPFLDPKFMEDYGTIPQESKYFPWQSKKLQKIMAKRFLPNEILNRKKVPFKVPHVKWMLADFKPLMLERIFSSSHTGRIFRKSGLKEFLSIKHSPVVLWRVFLLIKWLDENF